MHEEYDDLEAMIGHDSWDEPWDEPCDETLKPHDVFGIEFNGYYQPEVSESDIAIQRLQDNHGESDIKKPVISELKSDLEIIKILPTDQPKIIKYLDEG